MTVIKLLVSAVFLGISSFVVAQVHQPEEMMASKTEMPQEEIYLNQRRADILNKFKQAYLKKGEPKIAIFWNRKFDDQLSQWYQGYRVSHTGESFAKGQIQIKPNDEKASEVNLIAKEKNVSAKYVEVRQEQQRQGFAEAEGFEFESSFTSTFLAVPATIVDRATIMRLTQRQSTKESGIETVSDQQKIETDSLIGHADFFAEVLLTPNEVGVTAWSFMVSVKSVKEGRIVAMFKSDALNSPKLKDNKRWVATNKGFVKVDDRENIATPEQLGVQLAYETMRALTNVWH